MTYFAMARRFRPQRFADVAAQAHITQTLQKALETDRVASAYLFTGPRGSGKTTVARLLAKAINCSKRKKGEPCASCDSCLTIAEGRSLDVLEIDGASNNSVDDIRELRENVRYAASAPGMHKVYIIDEVHMLSAGAFNALLKTLEEPPAHVLFIFATTEARKVPPTIMSRCQRFDFRRLHAEEIHQRLQHVCQKEKVDIDEVALQVLAKRADGSLRDGLSLLDQVLSSSSGRVTEAQVAAVLGLVREETYLELTEAIAKHDAAAALACLHAALREGADPSGFALGLVEHLRNVLLLSVDAALEKSVQLGREHLARSRAVAASVRTEDLLYLLNRAAAVYEDTRRTSNPTVTLEAAMVELAHFESRVVLSEVLERLERDNPSGPSGARSAAGHGQLSQDPPRSPRSGRAAAHDAAPLPAPAAGDEPQPQRPRARAETGATAEIATTPPPSPTLAAGGPATWGGSDSNPAAVSGSSARPSPTAVEERSAPQFESAVSLELLRQNWAAFTQRLRSSKAIVAHCLSEGSPQALQGRTIHVAFPPEHAFHRNLLQEPATLRDLESHLRAYFGVPLQVKLCDAGVVEASDPGLRAVRLTPADVAQSRRAAAADVMDSAPRLREILDAFDGEILEDRET